MNLSKNYFTSLDTVQCYSVHEQGSKAISAGWDSWFNISSLSPKSPT